MITGIVTLIIVSIYFAWLFILAVAWMRHSVSLKKRADPVPVSILIPCRNEANNIINCLENIYSQDYSSPLTEIIIIDDHSNDGTPELVEKYGKCRLIKLPDGVEGKKAAIALGIEAASNELIITRDADTTADKYWLQTIAGEYKTTNADLLIGPVTLIPSAGFLNLFERLEFYAFTIITGGTAFIKKPVLCNGANLCFKKSMFNKVEGYKGNEHIASGDDVFLLNKINREPNSKIVYIKNYKATVFSPTKKSWYESIQQRLRWAGKNTSNNNLWSAFTGVLVLFTNISWLLIGILSVFSPQLTGYFAILAAIKCIIDFLLLFLGSTFHRQGKALLAFPLMVLLYPAYIAVIVAMSVLIKPTWKGRNIN